MALCLQRVSDHPKGKGVGGRISKSIEATTVLPSPAGIRSESFFSVFAVFVSLDGITAGKIHEKIFFREIARVTAGRSQPRSTLRCDPLPLSRLARHFGNNNHVRIRFKLGVCSVSPCAIARSATFFSRLP